MDMNTPTDFDLPARRGGLDRFDPRVRLLVAVAAAWVFSVLRQPAAVVVAFAAAAILLGLSHPNPRTTAKRLFAVNVFVLFMALTIPLSVPGEPLFQLGPGTWSREGVVLAGWMAVKANAIALSFIALVAGLGPARVGAALDRLRVPPPLVFLFLTTARHLDVLGTEWNRLQTAAVLRGFVPRPARHTYRTLGAMLGHTFVRAVDRSGRVHEAMRLRGFDGQFRTAADLRAGARDVGFALVSLGIFGLVGGLNGAGA